MEKALNILFIIPSFFKNKKEADSNNQYLEPDDTKGSLRRAASIFFFTLIFLIVGAFYWAAVVEIDEVIRASGKIIPATQAKTVQSEFQGSIDDILVEEGEIVEKNQILFKLVDIDFVTEKKMNDEQYFSSLSKLERLRFEAKLEKPIFSDMLREKRPDLVLLQMEIYQARAETLAEEVRLLRRSRSFEQTGELLTQLKTLS